MRSTPTHPIDRLRRTVGADLAAGRLAEAAATVRQALAEVPEDDPNSHGELLELRTRITLAGGPEVTATSAEELQRHAAILASSRPELAARLLTEAAVVLTYSGARAAAVTVAEEAVRLSSAADATTAGIARLALGVTLAFSGAMDRAAPLLAEADRLDAGRDVAEAVHYLQYVVMAFAAAERYPAAVGLASRLVGSARALRADGVLSLALGLLANSAYFTADFTTTRLAAEEARALAESLGQQTTRLYAHVCLLMAAAATGDSIGGREHAAAALDLLPAAGVESLRPTIHAGLGLLAVTERRYGNAVGHFADAEHVLRAQGVGASGMLQWRENMVEALVRTGRRKAAERELVVLGASIAGSAWRSAAVDRCRGLLAADPDEARSAFAAALAHHQRAASIFEAARTRLCFAEHLLGSEPVDPAGALDQLAAARDAFSHCGAGAWVARTEELQADARSRVPAAACGAGKYELRLLGGFVLSRGGRPTPRPAELHTRALVAVCLAGGRLPVDELVEELWPGEPPGAGRTRLRNVLARLRGRYGPLLCRDGAAVRLDGTVTVDVLEFSRDAHRALTGDRGDPATVEAARRAVARYRGELLPADRHVESTAAPRERLRRQLLALLDLLAQDARGRGDLSAAAEWLDQAITVEPYDLARYPQLAGLLTVLGREADARRVLARADAVHTELGVPSPAEPPAVERRPGRLSW